MQATSDPLDLFLKNDLHPPALDQSPGSKEQLSRRLRNQVLP
ncbi:hypothetical protein Spb1_10460 [Planctopirus ephydatiae]|uniref:Uncharacterized protein n=1 Tax=Planctopirus ephydatiae TaxID=2528019 RepID=A0A518GKT5_9PLAN|nr:hypothetical protein Spb1_10460 [Planctopirus ephydatiae]